MILSSDIKIYYSGGASNSDPALSIGGEFSSVEVPAALENLFPTLTDSDTGFDISEYRCIYVFNTNATDNVFDLKTIFANEINSPAQLYLGFNTSDDVQKITITGQPVSGSIVLTYTDFLGTDYDTNVIPFGENLNTFAQNIQNELNLLNPIFGNIVCTSFDSPTYQYIEISFTGLDGNRIHNLLTVKTNNLVGSSTVVLDIEKIVAGSPINTEAELLVNSEQTPTDIDFLSETGFITLLSLRAQEGFPIWIKRTITSSTVPAILAGAELQFTMLRTQFPSTPKPTVPPTPTPNPTASPCPTATPNVLFMKGANNFGQIGNNSTIFATEYAQPVGDNVPFIKISTSSNTAYGIKSDGTLWAWGNNTRGELGDGTTTRKSSPVQTVAFGTTWSSVASRTLHASAIKTDGTLWNWGSDNFGELGTNTNISGTSSPVQTCAFGSDWSKVATGNSFVGAIKTDGTLWLWGHNIYGQLGNDSTTALGFGISSPVQTCTFTTDWSSIACGFDHSAAIKKDGTLWCWGRNSFGQLGCNDTSDKSSPIQTVSYGNDWQKVSCGTNFTLAIKNDGTLWSWGYNYTGSLGDNTSINKSSPVQVYGNANDWVEVSAASNTIALNSSGELWEFGSYGTSSPIQIYACGFTWKEVANAGSFYGGITASLPTPSPTLTPTPTPTPSSTGATPTPTASPSPTPSPMPVVSTYYLFTWGKNSYGNLGDNTTVHRSSPVQTVAGGSDWYKISVGGFHGGAIKNDGSLWTWGNNQFGELGINTDVIINVDKSSPVQVGTDTTWSTISFGRDHSAAIKNDGTLWCWGSNVLGECGLGDVLHRSSPVQVGNDTDWNVIAASWSATSAIKNDGTLWSWGSNYYGELGDNTLINRSSPTQVGTDTSWSKLGSHPLALYTTAIKKDGTLWVWGENAYGKLGINSTVNKSSPVQLGTENTWSQVSSGDDTTAAIKTDGTLWCWGRNYYGTIGNNSTSHRSSPVQTISAGTNWQQVSTGDDYICAIKKDGTLWSWGFGFMGSLGTNNFMPTSSPVQVGSFNYWKDISCGIAVSFGLLDPNMPTPTLTPPPTPTPTPTTTSIITPTATPTPTIFSGLGVLYIAWE